MDDVMREYVDIVNRRLAELIRGAGAPELLEKSMSYSLMAGGKRIRPVLNILSYLLVAEQIEQTLDLACGIEMIHTYSLIHDDLPAMDNDDLRRGRPTNHIVFGEGQAILAGDGLLNLAYEVMLKSALRYPIKARIQLKAIETIAQAAGVSGMIAGQVRDLELEGKEATEQDVFFLHERKSGDLICGSVMSGVIAGGATENQMAAAEIYGRNIGLVFQIIDDILDATATAEELGKTPGKDEKNGKATYVSLYGIDKSKQIAKNKTDEACDALALFGENAKPLVRLARDLLKRTH